MKKGVNQSELIRNFIADHPELKGGAEILSQMAKEGKKVSKQLVYTTLSKMKSSAASPKTSGKKPGRPKGSTNASKGAGKKPGSTRAKAATMSPSSNEDLFAAMQNFVNAAGSLEKAIDILSVFKR